MFDVRGRTNMNASAKACLMLALSEYIKLIKTYFNHTFTVTVATGTTIVNLKPSCNILDYLIKQQHQTIVRSLAAS